LIAEFKTNWIFEGIKVNPSSISKEIKAKYVASKEEIQMQGQHTYAVQEMILCLSMQHRTFCN
jgi:translation initiation factor 1 (eIF-1/SUI1)